jgi:hypothetical protein
VACISGEKVGGIPGAGVTFEVLPAVDARATVLVSAPLGKGKVAVTQDVAVAVARGDGCEETAQATLIEPMKTKRKTIPQWER